MVWQIDRNALPPGKFFEISMLLILFLAFRQAVTDCGLSDLGYVVMRILGKEFVPRQSLRRFKYENSWSLEPHGAEVVRQSWGSNGDSDVMSKLVRGFWDVALLNHAEYELNLVLRQEEEYWKQRAKLFWLKVGDSNSRAFHLAASKRRSRNAIANLRGEAFAVEEVKDALFAMHPDKSPDSLNRTNIVLIPKKSEVISMTDLQPISLCNVIFKIASKLLANRLKKVLDSIVSEAQNAFVPGRSITDSQEINLNKYALTFSRNTDDVVKRGICSILQVEEQADPGIYLGMPAVVGKNKRQLFEFVRRKVWNRIQNWNGRRLSRAGKEICLKTVAQSIPTYVMQLLLLPKDLCRDIESMMNDFFWDSNPQCRSIRWMSWDKMWTKVQVWGDSWLPDSSNRLIITLPIAGFDGIKVDELITEGLWREDFIRDKFMARDADLILSIPLPMSSREDQISWSFDARVMEGYNTSQNSKFCLEGARNCLPTRFALTIHHVDTPMCCPICRSEPETTLHALVECVVARDVWHESGLAMLQGNFGSFMDWLATMFTYCDSVVFAKYLAVCWGLWWRRNDVVWNGRIRHSQQVVNGCFTMLESWFHANETLATAVTIPSYSSKWQKPDYGWININVDGAVFLDKDAIGAVFRDHQGRFMGGFAKPFPHQTLLEVVEALGVREVLSWIHERSRSRIVVETDCLLVVQAIQHKSCPNMSFGFIMQTV
ncbi:hypothetical protein CK203_064945 [Vitis vinifera]|uniref:RNase H type-1 domain-containing protein n=1 Tax=Vitis vinifera TaxID=29760 RepID=A0A438HGA1_VITVI|nr:hypothetical protein CK203_064945 [Vitis vinifera]